MKIELTNTDRIITLEVNGAEVPARIWEGTDEHGVPVIAAITRIAVPTAAGAAAHERFQRELQETALPPSAMATEAIPMRMVIP
jgi:hypothetical protein